MSVSTAVRIEGGLLGPDTFERLLTGDLPGQGPRDFGFEGRRSLTDEIASIFTDALAQWAIFKRRLEHLPETDLATTLTRDVWITPFFSHLGYDLWRNRQAYEVDGATFAISHRAGEEHNAPPVHIVGARQSLSKISPTGRPRLAPHSLVQEFLNRTEHLWGIVTNGLTLRLLRDSTYIRRQAYVEFDLAQIFDDKRFNDFMVLCRLLHRTRLPKTSADAHDCWLERYYQHTLEQGGRIRERLRDGVEQCIKRLANAFLGHSANGKLRNEIAEGKLTPEELYRQLLRLVYRLLFLLVSEERGLISDNFLYRQYYGVSRLRSKLDQLSAYTDHVDLWRGLQVLWEILSKEHLAALLEVSPLNGKLFEPMDLDSATITNRELLEAFWHLAYYRESPSAPLRRVNYAALDVEELGSVYESLLDYRPQIDWSGSVPVFELAPGSERKSTGSYYTPPELVQELIKNALDPVIRERLKEAERMANGEWRMVPQSVRERFINEHVFRLSRYRGTETGDQGRSESADPGVSSAGNVWAGEPDAASGDLNTSGHRGGMGTPLQGGVHSVSPTGQWQPDRTGFLSEAGEPTPAGRPNCPGQTAPHPETEPPAEKDLAIAWSSTPFAIRYSLLAEPAILSVRVLDPACGSGHFLLAAARRLGKELARIRTRADEPDPDDVRKAIRDVVTHCIYGVDKNPLAVELCRVALWLEAHCEGKPLTFLDHRIRCGDSLVGIADLEALRHGIPDDAFKPLRDADRRVAREVKRLNASERSAPLFHAPFLQALENAAKKLRALEDLPEDTLTQVQHKAEETRRIQETSEIEKLYYACNVWTAAFFQPFTSGALSFVTTGALHEALHHGHVLHARTGGFVDQVTSDRRFFHWPLAFPEVFAQGGFDVVIGNPPFMGGLKISGNLGPHYRNWLETIFSPFGGTTDLCAAFYRRAFDLLRPGGRFGMVATNTIGQGDTRESGLAVILKQGGTITFAQRFIKWPGAANVEVNLVAVRKPDHSPLATRDSPILDNQPVPFISSRLDADPEGDPKRLRQNEGKAFQGDIVRGIGFVLDPDEAKALLAKDPRNADCLFPYLNGEDLNSHPQQKPSRWVICFHDWDLERAQQYPDLLRIVEERVKTERERLRGPGDARNREYWWQFGAYRAGMRRAIAPLQRVLVRSRVSELHALVFVRLGSIYNEQLVVFAFDDDYHFALLQSSLHEVWLRKQASSLRTDIRYTPTDCFDTFPFPKTEYDFQGDLKRLLAIPEFAEAARIGAEYHEHRRQVMLNRWLGLTKTYNLFHDPNCNDADIVRLRELHVAMDRAILACYGWSDLNPEHGFYQNDRGQTRFTVSPNARRELLHRLMVLNEKVAAKQDGPT